MTAAATALPSLADRRAALLAEQAKLQHQRGVFTLEGRTFDARRLAAIDAELAGLLDAEAEDLRRRDQAAKAHETERRASVCKRIAEREQERRAALAKAEAAARVMVNALDVVRSHTIATRAEIAELGVPPPLALDPRELETRLSRYLANSLSIVANGPGFGVIEWNSIPFGDGPWAELERAATAAALAEFIETPTEETKP
jgi:hypothetical protein